MSKLKEYLALSKYIIGFLLFGWVVNLINKIKKQESELTLKNYELKEVLNDKKIDSMSIDELVKYNNSKRG